MKNVYHQYQGTIVSCCHTILLVLFVLCLVFRQVQGETPRTLHVKTNARKLALAPLEPNEDLDVEVEQYMQNPQLGTDT